MGSSEKVGQESVAIARTDGGRFAPGHAGGPGRPKKGQSLSELWRRGCDWEKIRTRLEAIAHSPKAKDSDSIAAARELLDRAWGRPLASHELHVSGAGEHEPRDFSHLSIARRRELLAELQGANGSSNDSESSEYADVALLGAPQGAGGEP